MSDLFRVYELVGEDGYPPEWHATIKHLVREEAGHRCVRCGHPYHVGRHPMEREYDDEGGFVYVSWSPCDDRCTHGGETRLKPAPYPQSMYMGPRTEARARILTVHHLNGDKADCRWWNLASLCQRCHLRIQRTVVLPRVFPWEHTEWFKPYAAGWYAHAYLGEDLTREETLERLDELLALERVA